MTRQGLPASPAGPRTSPRNKTKRHARTSNNSKPETPSARAKRKRNAATARAKVAAGKKRAKPKATGVQEIPADKNTKESGPVDIATKPHKKRVVPPPGKKRKQIAPKKAVAKGGWDTPEEIDDSSYSDEEVDEEKDKLGDDEDDEEKSSSSEDDNDAVPHDSSDENSSTDRMLRFQRDIERTNEDVDRRRCEELNQRAQQGAEDPPNDTSLKANTPSSTRGFDSGSTVPRGMSNTVSIVKREKHVATRIMQFVKSEVFRRIKFVNSAEMFQKAFVKVIEFEKVPPHNCLLFQLTYKSCFNKALNTKRSSCEQAGGVLARKAIANFKKRGEDFFTFEEFCKLRRAATERERRAFFWFFDSFLECVCGARAWRNAKKTMLVSESRDEHDGVIVTKSDEAFALLLIDNYLEKWKMTLGGEEQSADAEAVNNTNMMEEAEDNGRQGKKTTAKLPGKYTEKKSGHCKYGGWSRAGMARFNQLYSLVNDDRASVQSEQMERELLAFCRTQAGMSDEQHDEQQEGVASGNNAHETAEAMPVEATWDSDND
jgi:hypothetical protein